MKDRLFYLYKDGIQIYPIGIICGSRIRGFGFGVWKHRGGDFEIGIGAIFRFHIIRINWKVFFAERKKKSESREGGHP